MRRVYVYEEDYHRIRKFARDNYIKNEMNRYSFATALHEKLKENEI